MKIIACFAIVSLFIYAVSCLDETDVCSLDVDTGMCNAAIDRWYYDRKDGSCKQFIYKGCKGNGNRFAWEDVCRSTCMRKHLNCLSDEFFCRVKGDCIKKSWVCDGDNDCGDASDEYDCNCSGHFVFRCDDGQCMKSHKRCDGTRDCMDGSDENECRGNIPSSTTPPSSTQSPVTTGHDCADILKRNSRSTNGIYEITVIPSGERIEVYCDMTTNGGGWTVFQRRIDGTEDFYRSWRDYAEGFGHPTKEFWLGNEHLSSMTSSRQYRLRIDLGDWSGNFKYTEYRLFKVYDSRNKYRLELETFSNGNAGDSMYYQNGQKFSTYDQDNDGWPGDNLAIRWSSGWWHSDKLFNCNLNGVYNKTYPLGVLWDGWQVNLRFVEMKIRPVSF